MAKYWELVSDIKGGTETEGVCEYLDRREMK
jgi:hypothetical protein